MGKNSTQELFKRICRKALKPVPKITVSEWADTYRMLSRESSAEPGRWKTSRAEYQREIMDSFTSPDIWKIIVKSAAQIGKSDIMNNVVGRFAHLDPAPILMIQPTIDMAQDYSKSRISPMIQDTRVLKNIFADVKTRDTNNTILSKMFPGGRLIMGGANSPAGLASRPVRIVLADEVDRFPVSAGSEGDPVDLAAKRTTTFHNRLIGMFSTPTIKGASRIDEEYMTGTQEEWQHKCPACGEWHMITHRNISTDYVTEKDSKGKEHYLVTNARWCCPSCGVLHTQTEMQNAEQKYIAQNPTALEKGVRSFFINAFASPWLTWTSIMQEWLEAKGDSEREKVIYNTRFGESYEPKGNFENEHQFLARRENYGAELPEGVLILTAAVDVQHNRLEFEVCGWGEGEECWGIQKGIILGAPDEDMTWTQLDVQLDREYKFANGTGLIIARTFIDSGDGVYMKEVYRYCLKSMHKQRFAIKGGSEFGIPLIHKVSKQTVLGKVTIPLVIVGVSNGKQYVMDRLAIETPGPKYFHFPLDGKEAKGDMITESLWNRGYDDIYFKGLIAEKLEARVKNGRITMKWVNVATDKRNEPLDLRVYNLACISTLNPDYAQLKAILTGNKQVNPSDSKPEARLRRTSGRIKRGLRSD